MSVIARFTRTNADITHTQVATEIVIEGKAVLADGQRIATIVPTTKGPLFRVAGKAAWFDQVSITREPIDGLR